MLEQIDSLQKITDTTIDMGFRFGPKLLTAIAIVVAGYYAGQWAGRATGRTLQRLRLEPPVQLLLLRVVRALVLLLFLVLALQNLGVELLPLIAGVSVAGAGIALAMQGVLSNVVAGLTIIFTRPYRVGEYIAIAGVEGKVDSIDLFSTTLGHNDRSRVVVPNRKIVGEILHNYGEVRQLDLAVGVPYEADIARALDTVRAVLDGNLRVLKEPAAVIQVAQLANSSINIAVRPWVRVPDFASALGEINQAIVERFRAANIAMPLPKYEVRMLGRDT